MKKTELDLLLRGVEELVPEKEFQETLNTKKPLRIKLGFDPTAPDLHPLPSITCSLARTVSSTGSQFT